MTVFYERLLVKGGSYIISLDDVDFITWRKNRDDGKFWLKCHIGTKEVRYVCDTMSEVTHIVNLWAQTKNLHDIKLTIEDLGENDGFDN